MYLKELTITGFKSFAKKSELEFSVPITAIVGPNGSGKSNVAESFRFVLGEQSVKSMRGKKGEDLIWGGSSEISRGNRASVNILLDNKDKIFPVDFEEISIERIVHRDGQNEYLLNGSAVRLKDIQELLASANIGSTGHHIISQGEADRVLSANAKERREMIEEALGLKVYQYKKQEAEKKLAKTLQNVTQVESLRRENAPHLKYLEKQVQKIEKSLQLQEKLKSVYADYLCREDIYIAYNHDQLIKKREEPESRLKEIKKAILEAKETLKKTEAKEDLSQLEKVRNSITEASKDRQIAEREYSKCEGQITFLERRLTELSNRKEKSEEKMIAHSEIVKLVTDIEKQAEKARQQDNVSYLQRALADMVHSLKIFLEKTQTAVVNLVPENDQDELDRLKKEIVKLEEKLKTALKKEEELKAEYAELEKEQTSQLNQGREAEREVFRLTGEEREIETKLDKINSELDVLDRDRREFKEELQEAVALLGRGAARYYEHEVKDEEGEPLKQEQIANEDRKKQKERRHELEKMKIRLEELGVGASEDIVKEHKNAKERDNFLAREITDLEESIEKLRSLISELEEKLEVQFGEGIDKISVEFNKFFVLMFGGGEAGLIKVKNETSTDDEIMSDDGEKEKVKKKENGIELSVKLPNKRVNGLEMLSGGERALTSIALIFAMSQVNPPPFIILDETDAALDEANSRRYGDMIEALAEKSQLILITHNRETMSRAGILYGVTMGSEGTSKLLSVKLDEAVAVAK